MGRLISVQELVERTQRHQGNLDSRDTRLTRGQIRNNRVGAGSQGARRWAFVTAPLDFGAQAPHDRFGVESLAADGCGRAHPFQEERRQDPVPIDVGMIERRRTAPQGRQVMKRIENLLAVAITARMLRDHASLGHHHNARDIPLHRHRPKGIRPRHAVAIRVEAHGLIFIDLAWPRDARIERPLRQ